MGQRTVTAFTVDALTDPEAVTASASCQRITIREQGAAGMVRFNVRGPGSADPVVEYVEGEPAVFGSLQPGARRFVAGEIVGYVETLSGSADFSQTEEWL